MCGVIALLLAEAEANCSGELYEGLNVLQHRGQDAAGIITAKKAKLYQCKGNGLVKDVFTTRQMLQLLGNMGLAHVRYPTAGSSSPSEAQPFYVNSPYGLALAHNGNLTNSSELTQYLEMVAHRHINTDSDSEVLLNILADELQRGGKARINEEDLFSAITSVFQKCRGGYALAAMIAGYGIIGMRDPNGIRPMVYGRRDSPSGSDYIITSETVAIDSLGFTLLGDIQPGECILITKGGNVFKRQCAPNSKLSPCIFEYVYFARPDSIIDGISVYHARLEMGEELAGVIKNSPYAKEIDVVIPVPDTSRTAALQCAYKLGISYREGFIKNRYIGRTFIMPGQALRKKAVRRKLNAMHSEFTGKNVLLVDDSIVRGTTSKEIILMAREAGAKKVFFASCSPPIRYPNVYGIDMPSAEELIAHSRTEEEIAKEIGADAVIYLSLDGLVKACTRCNPDVKEFETSVFTGVYITGDVNEQYLSSLQNARKDVNKRKASEAFGGESELIGLYNFPQAS